MPYLPKPKSGASLQERVTVKCNKTLCRPRLHPWPHWGSLHYTIALADPSCGEGGLLSHPHKNALALCASLNTAAAPLRYSDPANKLESTQRIQTSATLNRYTTLKSGSSLKSSALQCWHLANSSKPALFYILQICEEEIAFLIKTVTCACWRTARSSRTIGSSAAFLFAILLLNCWTMLDMSSSVWPFIWSNSLFIVDTLSIASCVFRNPLTPCRASTEDYTHSIHSQLSHLSPQPDWLLIYSITRRHS